MTSHEISVTSHSIKTSHFTNVRLFIYQEIIKALHYPLLLWGSTSSITGRFPAQGANNAENVVLPWRHRVTFIVFDKREQYSLSMGIRDKNLQTAEPLHNDHSRWSQMTGGFSGWGKINTDQFQEIDSCLGIATCSLHGDGGGGCGCWHYDYYHIVWSGSLQHTAPILNWVAMSLIYVMW